MTARAPCSTANLGPGFDVFGLALDAFYDRIKLTRTTKPGVRIIVADGVPADVQKNTAGIVVRSMARKFKIKAGVNIEIKKGVPAGFGMGSSAASAAAAAVAFNKLFKLKLDKNDLVRFAGMGERASAGTIHYDNVAASVLGGFVIVRSMPFNIIKICPPKDLALCVAVPLLKVPEKKTKVSRGVIPEMISVSDSIENISNAARIVAGFMSKDTKLIGDSIRDAIVEPARSRLIPGYAKIKYNAMRAGAFGVTISGAGPSVIAFADKSSDLVEIGLSMKHGFNSAKTECAIITCGPSNGAMSR